MLGIEYVSKPMYCFKRASGIAKVKDIKKYGLIKASSMKEE